MIANGTIIDERYEILKELDRGGMGIVYLADDNRLKKPVAIKDILISNKINASVLLKCLKAEVDLLKGLDHPNLPKIYDVIEEDDHIYVVMDYVEGESLQKKLDRGESILVNDVIDWAKQLSNVLGYLHDRKPTPIIYRDMKPDNIMLTPEGKIKLIDFGIAIQEDQYEYSINLATKLYGSPEQLSGKRLDCRTDIYSLGVTLYHLVTGRTKKEEPELRPIREINPSLPEGLEIIISKCIEDDPDYRYENCDDLSYDLKNIQKLTADYKKNVIKKITPFIICFSLFIISSIVSIVGKNGLDSENLDAYKTLLNEASVEQINGNNSKSIEILDKAITEVNSSNSEAYINILDIYISMDNAKEGLTKIEGYINDEYGNVNKNNQVLFKVGMTYLDLKNYPIALKYFQQVDSRRIPEVKYYRTIANSMSNMNIDYVAFKEELEEFEIFVDTLANDGTKLLYYNSLANIYGSYKGQINNANDKIIEIINKADLVLETIDDKQLELKYEIEFCQKLAQAYHSKGSNATDKNQAKSFFYNAINLYSELLDLEINNSEDVLIKIGDIYSEMSDFSSAISYYKKSIDRNPSSVKSYSKLISILLDIEQSKETGKNYNEALNYYNTAINLPGANESEDFKKIKRRMVNLEIL